MSPRSEKANQEIREKRREQIIAAALKVFAKKGLSAAKISDIALEAGLSYGLFYHYFSSKDELFTILVKQAFETSLSIFQNIPELPGTPWDKLKTITELIIPGAYQGIGSYYFLIIIEAHISETVPKEVKRMNRETAPLYNKYLVPLVKAGQQKGEIIDGEPEELATAYFSLIQGLAVMRLQGGELIIPEAETVLSLFKKREQDKKLDGSNLSGNSTNFSPVDFTQQHFIYKTKGPEGNEILDCKVKEVVVDNLSVYIINEESKNGKRTVMKIRKDNWKPLLIERFNNSGKPEIKIEYQDSKARIMQNDKRKKIQLYENSYDVNTLFYLFAGYPFTRKKKVNFKLVMDGRGGGPLGVFPMYVEEEEQEVIKVPAGTCDCFKLKMGIAGAAGFFARKYRFYFWYAVECPGVLIKYEDMQGNQTQ